MNDFDYDYDGCSCDWIEWEPVDGYEGCPFCEHFDELQADIDDDI